MQTTQDKTFNDLVEQFLGIRIPQQMAGTISLSELTPDTKNFIMRMLPLMKLSGYSGTGFNSYLIRWIFKTVPSILPSAWGGRIPPITLPGRHKKLDAYVARQNRTSEKDKPIFVDAGCGFPPLTTAETALKLQDWQVYGIDHSFADYVLYDVDGHYACFGKMGEFQYFQALMNTSGQALYADPDATRNRFKKLFSDLFPLVQNPDGSTSETVEKDGNKLIHNHIRNFETDNLTFLKEDIKELKLPPVKVIRCMNILIYFDSEIRKKILLKASELLDDDGILIAGTNGFGIQSRYAVYQKNSENIFPSKFSFSSDNLGHIVFMPFFTIHENDPEAMLLAELTGVIRTNGSFWPEFSNRVDELQKHHAICHRGSDGFLHFPEREMSHREYLEKNAMLWRQMDEEGYIDRVVHILGLAGYNAWKNSVGDITIRPHSKPLPLY